mmetsp:Transcript_117791/g.345060  ORF Transcript_117791/g.345060 Transcript_117791/m.345060 type:complete len:407 (-) Transcript_117791:175-1395(-)
MDAAADGVPAAKTAEGPLDVHALDHVRTCRTCCRQGAKGRAELQREVRAGGDARWVRRIPLNDAIMSDNLTCLRYLVDEVKVETLNDNSAGYSPLQFAIIWGKLEIMVYLLSRGADPMLEGESSVVDMARLRQQRLQEALEQSGDGAEFEGFTITKSRIRPLLEEGLAMLEVLEGIEAAGSYQAWATNNGRHPLVRRFSSDIRSSEPRYQLALLRALVLAGQASLRSAAERAALEAEEAAKAAARAKAEQPVMDALVEAGFSSVTAKEIRDTFRTPTIKALRAARLSSEDVEAQLEAPVRQKRMTEGERRKFSRFVRELEESAPTPAPAAASKAAAKGAAKSKAKGPAPAAKAALLAMGAKGAGRGAAAKEPQAKKAKATDGMALFFHEALPRNAFALTTTFLLGL